MAERHIRVDLASGAEKKLDTRHSIFVGNLPFDVEDEDLWTAFAPCGTMQRVRVVRDPKTNMGKGFAYVQVQAESMPSRCRPTRAAHAGRRRTPFCTCMHWRAQLRAQLMQRLQDRSAEIGAMAAPVQFSDVSGVEMALQAEAIKVGEREVRISRAVKQNKLDKGTCSTGRRRARSQLVALQAHLKEGTLWIPAKLAIAAAVGMAFCVGARHSRLVK